MLERLLTKAAISDCKAELCFSGVFLNFHESCLFVYTIICLLFENHFFMNEVNANYINTRNL